MMWTKLIKYEVWRIETPPDDPRPFCIVKVSKEMENDTLDFHIVDSHNVGPLAHYWATMLNAGQYTEEEVIERIKTGNK